MCDMGKVPHNASTILKQLAVSDAVADLAEPGVLLNLLQVEAMQGIGHQDISQQVLTLIGGGVPTREAQWHRELCLHHTSGKCGRASLCVVS